MTFSFWAPGLLVDLKFGGTKPNLIWWHSFGNFDSEGLPDSKLPNKLPNSKKLRIPRIQRNCLAMLWPSAFVRGHPVARPRDRERSVTSIYCSYCSLGAIAAQESVRPRAYVPIRDVKKVCCKKNHIISISFPHLNLFDSQVRCSAWHSREGGLRCGHRVVPKRSLRATWSLMKQYQCDVWIHHFHN